MLNRVESYQRAFVDFFEDELVLGGYDWRKVLDEFLFKGKEPLINCVIAGREYIYRQLAFRDYSR